jgi:ferric-dicitrate binding protein FerR (iron transport regulator)
VEQSTDFEALFLKLANGTCSPEEADLLTEWLGAEAGKEASIALLAKQVAMPVGEEEIGAQLKAKLNNNLQRILQQHTADRYQRPVHQVHFLRRNRWWAAAAVLLLVAGLSWFVVQRIADKSRIALHKKYKNDVAPGHNGAVLTLADGSTIVLDSAGNGAIAKQAGAEIIKSGDGRVLYQPVTEQSSTISYNTLTTPRGRKFSLTLPDGSQVWLNAQSSITFPSAFTGKERVVDITGEAYFEIAQNKNMPFTVRSAGQQVQVLGTSFNINTYIDEPVAKTTLLNGSIKVIRGDQTVVLQPGEQALGTVVANANLSQTMAWKNDSFYFEGTDLKTIMRQVSRWYDVEVVFAADAPNYDFRAIIPSNLPVSELLKLLELTKLVHFEIDGKKITVKS